MDDRSEIGCKALLMAPVCTNVLDWVHSVLQCLGSTMITEIGALTRIWAVSDMMTSTCAMSAVDWLQLPTASVCSA